MKINPSFLVGPESSNKSLPVVIQLISVLSNMPGCCSVVLATGRCSRSSSSGNGKQRPFSAEAIGMSLTGLWGLGKGGGEDTPKLDFEPERLENGDINGNLETRGEAGWNCL